MTLQDRLDAYGTVFGTRFPDSVPTVTRSGRWVTAVWLLGNDYRGRNGFYGAYPQSYLQRVLALFPDVQRPLHLFSGSLCSTVRGVRVDLVASRRPTVQGDAKQLPFRAASFDLAVCDPPYGLTDARKYHTPPVSKRLVLREVARVVQPGGYLVWLDTTLPMYRKNDWHLWGLIGVQRSCNHRTRLCSLFTRIGSVAGNETREETTIRVSHSRLF